MGKKAPKAKKGKNAVADAVLGDVTDTIQGQKKILKDEMVAVIDRKLNEKIKDQLNEITELQETINRLKEGNNQFAISADQKLCELTTSVSQMNMMAEDLRALRSTTTKLEKECAEIRGKFDETSVKISESLSKLQLKVEEQTHEQNNMVGDIQGVREQIVKHQHDLETELAENQAKIDEQLKEIHEKMTIAIEQAKKEAVEESKCCTIL